MKYLVELIYRKCWDDIDIRRYVRQYIRDPSDLPSDRLLEILDALAAKCLGESDDLPPPI